MMSGRSISNCNNGTLCYSSPEVVKSEEFDTRTDIWSLGCIIYEMCTFSLPFVSTTERSLIDKIVTQKTPEFPSSHYSKEMKAIYESCLLKNKQERPTSKYLLGSEIL